MRSLSPEVEVTRSLFSYNNLLKAGWFEYEDDTLLIDNNERIAQKLATIQAGKPQMIVDEEELPDGDTELEEGSPDGLDALLLEEGEEGFASGLKAPKVELPVYEGPTPEELVAQAQEEADQIRQTAADEVERMKQEGFKEGKDQGYQEGYNAGLEKVKVLEAELDEKERQLEQRYQDKMRELEPQFVDTLNRIYERVFDVKFSEQRGLILHLLANAMRGIEETKDFILHVSPQDYQEVRDARAMLTNESLVGNATVEIIEDMTLQKNECFIETGGGIFDCSLGVELEQLQKELALLSLEK